MDKIMLSDHLKISKIIFEIGKKIIFKEKDFSDKNFANYIKEISDFCTYHKNYNQILNDEINEIKRKVEETKKFLNNEKLLFNSDELMNDFKEKLYNFDILVYIDIGIQEIKARDSLKELKEYYNKIEEISSGLYSWFYDDFEPYRLVLYNDYRKEKASQLPEDIKLNGLFPWYDLYCNEDPEIFFQLSMNLLTDADNNIPQNMRYALVVANKDELIKKYVHFYYKTAQKIKSSFDNNPELVIIYVVNLIDKGYEGYKEQENTIKNSNPEIVLKILLSNKESCFLALLFSPIDETIKYELMKRYKYNLVKRFPKYAELLNLTKQKDFKSLKQKIITLKNDWLKIYRNFASTQEKSEMKIISNEILIMELKNKLSLFN